MAAGLYSGEVVIVEAQLQRVPEHNSFSFFSENSSHERIVGACGSSQGSFLTNKGYSIVISFRLKIKTNTKFSLSF